MPEIPEYLTPLLRVESNAWGQEILLGLSWELTWIFLAGGLGFITLHQLYKLLIEPKLIRK
jgi:hypothetical protein